jgi:putative DNA-invertase from lambdoid prophage Rac
LALASKGNYGTEALQGISVSNPVKHDKEDAGANPARCCQLLLSREVTMILGYVRVSSADQAKDDRSSLQVQTDIIEGFARTRGVDKYGVQIFTDAGVSGAVKLSDRPAGADLLAVMSEGDTVIASKLDRMFRSACDALNMLEEFKRRKIHLVLFDMGHDPVTGDGTARLLFIILAAVADMERIRIKERTAEGRRANKAAGKPIGKVPFGFKKVGEGRAAVLAPDEAEQRAAVRMRELYQQNLSLPRIAALLSMAGHVSRAGTPYTPMSIRRVVMGEL